MGIDERLKKLLNIAKRERCSDLHITAGTALAIRKNGDLEVLEGEDDFIPSIQESEDMICSLLDESNKIKYLSGKDIDLGIMLEDGTRIRVNLYHQRNHLAACIRILERNIPTIDDLGLPKTLYEFAEYPNGLVLITGPTGSGKSTTLASMIEHINHTTKKHIMTIEDPIEYVFKHDKAMIHQREVGIDVDDFSIALRSVLREDPDVIMVGEMRDFETIAAAITAAETGHLVLSTLHTIGAAATIDRIIDVFPPHQQEQIRTQLANVLVSVVSQQLVPTIDKRGRVAAFEVMHATPAIRNLIRENKTHQIATSIQTSRRLGMMLMDDALQELYM